MTEELKLLPCPFCGSDKAPVVWDSNEDDREDCDCGAHGESWTVVCDLENGGCGASGCHNEIPNIAIERWNRRPAQTALTEEEIYALAGGSDTTNFTKQSVFTKSDLVAFARAIESRLKGSNADAQDAARYRWLRSRMDDDTDYKLYEHKKNCDYGMKQGKNLDAAIDKAIAAMKGNQ